MTLGASAQVPGVYFSAVIPRPADDLPRMDVAAFVGFAESGPLNLPVSVGSVAEFRNVFGNDIDLAWDNEYNRFQQSLLGATVEAFFSNGGERCVVVRVAGRDSQSPFVLTSRDFPLDSLYQVDSGVVQACQLPARSPGSWSDDLRVGTQLNTRVLPLDRSGIASSGLRYLFEKKDNSYRVRVLALPASIRRHDLVRLHFDELQLDVYLFVSETGQDEQGLWLGASETFWFEADSLGVLLSTVSENEGYSRVESLFAGTTESGITLAHLSINLLVWQNGALVGRVQELALHGEHSRCWQHLPADDLLYGDLQHLSPVDRDADLAQLFGESSEPRFHLGASFPSLAAMQVRTGTLRTVPLGMSALADFSQARPPSPLVGPVAIPDSLRNGLQQFSADLFIDPDFQDTRSDRLAAEIEYKHVRRNELLRNESLLDEDGSAHLDALARLLAKGVHSLYFDPHVSMIAVPDALHRPWSNDVPEFPHVLEAPIINSLEYDPERNIIEILWNAVAGAVSYELHHSIDPGSPQAVPHSIAATDRLLLEESDSFVMTEGLMFSVEVAEGCSKLHSFRIFANGYRQRSPWSATVMLHTPAKEFYDFGSADPTVLNFILGTGSVSETEIELIWSARNPESGAANLVDAYELQRASDLGFFGAQSILIAASSSLTHDELLVSDVPVYYRIRGIENSVPGPWSNTVTVLPRQLSKLVLQSPDEPAVTDLLAVHCACLRLCAVRNDAITLMALPEQSRTADALRCAQLLQNGNTISETLARRFGSGELSVPALNAGEMNALSFGALFHPWIINGSVHSGVPRVADEPVRRLPVLGAIGGTLAAQANARGAWISAANIEFVDVLGSAQDLSSAQLAMLFQQHVNAIRRNPVKFAPVALDTLSRSGEFQILSVRRLFNLLVRLIRREGVQYVFENSGIDFRNRVQHYWDNLLSDLFRRGALQGRSPEQAYRVITDESVNTPQQTERGRLIVELQLAPSRPLRFIRVSLRQNKSEQLVLEEL